MREYMEVLHSQMDDAQKEQFMKSRAAQIAMIQQQQQQQQVHQRGIRSTASTLLRQATNNNNSTLVAPQPS